MIGEEYIKMPCRDYTILCESCSRPIGWAFFDFDKKKCLWCIHPDGVPFEEFPKLRDKNYSRLFEQTENPNNHIQ